MLHRHLRALLSKDVETTMLKELVNCVSITDTDELVWVRADTDVKVDSNGQVESFGFANNPDDVNSYGGLSVFNACPPPQHYSALERQA